MKIQSEILNSFNQSGEVHSLTGGQNSSVRVDNAVLKPVGDNTQFCEWGLNILHSINPHGYRLSKPIKCNKGNFVYRGWCCTGYEPGEHRQGEVKQKLEVARLFHKDLVNIDFNDIPKADDPWSIAHDIAWQKENLPPNISKEAFKIIDDLICMVKLKENYKVQIIHSDLSGNILFDNVLSPLIIDFSPKIAPIEYAEAILVCDCIAWQGSPTSELELICNSMFSIEMIVRAVIFRLSTAAIFTGDNKDEFIKEYKKFIPILDYIKLWMEEKK